MAHDVRTGGTTGRPAFKAGTAKLLSAFVDFEANNEVANEVVSCIDIPINCCLEKAWYFIDRAEGGTLTLDLGITGGTVDGFVNGGAGNTVGVAVWSSGCTYAAGLQSAAASVLALIPKNDADYARIQVFAEVVDLDPKSRA